MGGHSPERPISLKTGQAIFAALKRRGYRAVTIDVNESLPWQLRAKKVEVAFLALHGPGGEDGTVQGCLDVMGIPYTGSGVRASAIAMDKPKTKIMLRHHGIPVADDVVFMRSNRKHTFPSKLGLPLVVKPASQGSTFGISIVRRRSEWESALKRAFALDEDVLAEPYIPGRELTVAVVNGRALPPVEIVAPGGFYDYEAKYVKRETQYRCPAPILTALSRKLSMLAERSYAVLGCEGAARVDFRVTSRGRPFVLELNTIPGMTERSLLPMAAAQAGMDYDTLTEVILQSALARVEGDGSNGGIVSSRKG